MIEFANVAGARRRAAAVCGRDADARRFEAAGRRRGAGAQRASDRQRSGDGLTTQRATDVRVAEPERIATAGRRRRRRAALTVDGAVFIVAADHPARGVLGVGTDRRAMADRRTLIGRLLIALANPRVDGVLASCDIIDDLALLGALDDKVAVGTMNRGGLAGAVWELDDGFISYDTEHLVAAHLDGGKMLLRIDPADAGTATTLAGSARAVQQSTTPADGDGRTVAIHQERRRCGRVVGRSEAMLRRSRSVPRSAVRRR